MTDTKKNENSGDHICSHKRAWFLNNWLRRLVQNPRKIVGEYINEGDSVIDLGCGPGFFSIAMAQMVGDSGSVTAVDLQEEMLAHVRSYARARNVENRVSYHKCQKDRVGMEPDGNSDFMLAFYMVHETPDPFKFFQDVKGLLKPGGRFLVVEPPIHVSRELFVEICGKAENAGFRLLETPKKKGGKSALFTI